MDSVTLRDKVYKKASKAAYAVGYAPDYVGQLCRKGVIDAVVLGKTWYVSEESLLAHKQSQSRANTATTRRDIEKQKSAHEQSEVPKAAVRQELRSFGRLPEARITYSKDGDDLLPSVTDASRRTLHTTEVPSVGSEKVGILEDTDDERPTDEEIGTEAYSAEEGASPVEEELSIPIRTINEDDATKEDSRPKTKPAQHYQYHAGAFVGAIRTDLPEEPDEEVSVDTPARRDTSPASSRRSPITYQKRRGALSVALAVLFIFSVANLVMVGSWSFTARGAGKVGLETRYHTVSASTLQQMATTVFAY